MEEELTRDLSSEIIDRIVARQKELSSMRKDRKKNKAVIEKFATPEVRSITNSNIIIIRQLLDISFLIL